jgi:hypothetical protein
MLLTALASLKRILRLVVILGLAACSAPNDEIVRKDFLEIAKRELPTGIAVTVTSIVPGEGDDDNVYQHVRFDLVATEDVVGAHGWLRSRLSKGEQRQGELVLLYQRDEHGEWVRKEYALKEPPEREAPSQ